MKKLLCVLLGVLVIFPANRDPMAKPYLVKLSGEYANVSAYTEEEILADPTVYDAIWFLIKELEYDGRIDCPCHAGGYQLRYCREGVQAYCPECGATYTFDTRAEAASEEYLKLDEIKLR